MELKTNSAEEVKDTRRINKLCEISSGMSERDSISLSYIVEKSSRIASVTFMLANVLEGESELKREMEKLAIGLIKDSSKSAHSKESRMSFTNTLLALVALLDTVGRSGRLSKMNTDILSNEVVALGELVEVIDWHKGRCFVEESFFREEIPKKLFTPEPMVTRSESYIRQENSKEVSQKDIHNLTRDHYVVRDEKDNNEKERVQYKDRIQEVQKDRRASILSLVQKKDKINVRDVTNVIKDCSEKTIQRELLALVRQGVLKKEGERRWSTYSFA